MNGSELTVKVERKSIEAVDAIGTVGRRRLVGGAVPLPVVADDQAWGEHATG